MDEVIVKELDDVQGTCCACLTEGEDIISITNTNDTSTHSYLAKLQTNIPEVQWDSRFGICLNCRRNLDALERFRQQCIEGEQIRASWMLITVKDEKCTALEPVLPGAMNNVEFYEVEDEDVIDQDVDVKPQNGDDSVDIGEIQLYDIVLNNSIDLDCNTNDGIKSEENLPISTPPSPPPKKPPTKKFKCELCTGRFIERSAFLDHIVVAHKLPRSSVPEKPYRCTKCTGCFSKADYMHRHLLYVHQHAVQHRLHRNDQTSMINPTYYRPKVFQGYTCTKCRRVFMRKTELFSHRCDATVADRKMATNNGRKQVEEEIEKATAAKVSQQRKSRTRRKFIVPNVRDTYECEICQTQFSTKYSYETHLHSHFTREDGPENGGSDRRTPSVAILRKFTCKKCGVQFRRHAGLTLHERQAHSAGDAAAAGVASSKSVKPPRKRRINNFSCEKCGGGFRNLKLLEVHKRKIHPKCWKATDGAGGDTNMAKMILMRNNGGRSLANI